LTFLFLNEKVSKHLLIIKKRKSGAQIGKSFRNDKYENGGR
jgi:hypothetical protein